MILSRLNELLILVDKCLQILLTVLDGLIDLFGTESSIKGLLSLFECTLSRLIQLLHDFLRRLIELLLKIYPEVFLQNTLLILVIGRRGK